VDGNWAARERLTRTTALPAHAPKDIGDPAPDGHPAITAAHVKHQEPPYTRDQKSRRGPRLTRWDPGWLSASNARPAGPTSPRRLAITSLIPSTSPLLDPLHASCTPPGGVDVDFRSFRFLCGTLTAEAVRSMIAHQKSCDTFNFPVRV